MGLPIARNILFMATRMSASFRNALDYWIK